MQPIEFADILSTDLQLAHTGFLTHALCLEGNDKITATREQGGFGWQILQKWYPHIRGR